MVTFAPVASAFTKASDGQAFLKRVSVLRF